VVHYQDQSGEPSLFSTMINSTHLPQLRLYITDSKGRPIPYQSDAQKECNQQYFAASMKIIIVQP